MRKKGYIKYITSKIVTASKEQLFWPTVIISVIGLIIYILFLYLPDSTSSSGLKTSVPSSGIKGFGNFIGVKGYVVGILFMIIFAAILIVSMNIVFRIVYYIIEHHYEKNRDRIDKLDRLVRNYNFEQNKLIVTKCFDEPYNISYHRQGDKRGNSDQYDTLDEIRKSFSYNNISDENILIINANSNSEYSKDSKDDLLVKKQNHDGNDNRKAKNCKINRTQKYVILFKCLQWHILVTIICYILLPLSHLLDNIIRENLDMTGNIFGGFTVLTFFVLIINAFFAIIYANIRRGYYNRFKNLTYCNIYSTFYIQLEIKTYRKANKLIALKYLDGSYYCNYKMYKTWEDLKAKYDIKDDEDYLIISVNKNAK